MKCEAETCIYNRRNRCICDEISINSLGMCDGYTVVTIDKDLLEREKEKQLAQIEE